MGGGAKLTGNHLPQARLLRRQQRAHPCPDMQVLAWGDENMLARPCVDCGLKTGCYCDYCRACDRCPKEEWADGQMTPLCTNCDKKHGACHFCRRLSWCTPPPFNATKPKNEKVGGFSAWSL